MAIPTRLKTIRQNKKNVCPGIISKPSLFPKVKFKVNFYREAVTLKSTLAWNSGEIEDQAKISTELLSQEIVK